MAALDTVKNAFIQKLIEKLLDGDKGSNLLGAVLVAILGAHINYMQALAGFKFENMTDAGESAKVVGTVVLAVFAWFVGKKKLTPTN